MDNFYFCMLLALSCAIGGLVGNLTADTRFTARDLINTCQQSLPRDQVCVLVAIPKKEL